MYCLTDLCCLCLVNSNTIRSILLEDNDGIVVKNKLEYVLSETKSFKSEVLKNICIDCLTALNYVYKFKRECLQNLISLNTYIESMATKPQEYIYFDSNVPQHNSANSPKRKRTMDIPECTVTSDNSQDPLIPENNEEIEIIKQELEYIDDEIDIKHDPLLLDGGDSDENSTDDFPNEPTNSGTAPKIRKTPRTVSLDSLPQRTRKFYDLVYNTFNEWRQMNNTISFSEETLLAYFKELTKKYKSSTSHTYYSILKSTLYTKHGVDIEPYTKVRALLKRHSKGCQPKKSKTFTGEEINKFINEAPDDKYLAVKVALIMGITGACRANELYAMKMKDLQFFTDCVRVSIPQIKYKDVRCFTVTDNFYHIVKKYADLRPASGPSNSFFFNMQNGVCTKKIMGINKFGGMGREIATFLQLQNPERYTGHCLRRSSATLCAEGYVTDPINLRYKINTARTIWNQILTNSTNDCLSSSISCASTTDNNLCVSSIVNANDNNVCVKN